MHEVEAYLATGVVSGAPADPERSWDALSEGDRVVLEGAIWYPMDGSAPERRGRIELASDDVLILAVDPSDVSVHAVWHPILVDVGPYRVTGELPAPPGFDPGRALTRPGGTFLAFRSVRIEILGGARLHLDRPWVLVNRYAVDRVAADLVLGFFFPGARLETPEGVPAA